MHAHICRHVVYALTCLAACPCSFLSLEAVQHLLRQLLETAALTPSIETPRYTVLQRCAEYEVRHYEPYVVAETSMGQGSGEGGGGGIMHLQACF